MPETPFQVLLTKGAEQDLEAIYDYLAAYDSHEKADQVLDQLLAVTDSIAAFPERGTWPPELAALGIREYRQLYFKPWRVIYRVSGQRVYVLLIADGRRDMQSLLMRRLLGA